MQVDGRHHHYHQILLSIPDERRSTYPVRGSPWSEIISAIAGNDMPTWVASIALQARHCRARAHGYVVHVLLTPNYPSRLVYR